MKEPSVRRKTIKPLWTVGNVLSKPLTIVAMTLVLLTSACETTVGSGIEAQTICDILEKELPTVSVEDTEQTKKEYADFLDQFRKQCPDGV